MADEKFLCNVHANLKQTGLKITQNIEMTQYSNGKLHWSFF